MRKKRIGRLAAGILCMLLAVSVMNPAPTVNAASKKEKAKAAYQEYLTPYVGFVDQVRFAILDINNDKVPELITATGTAFSYNIYSYTGGKVKYLATSQNGKISIYPNKKLVFISNVGNGGYSSREFMKFDGKKMVPLAVKTRQATDYTLTKFKTTYTVKGKKATKSKYNTYIKRLKKGAKKKKPTFHIVTTNNLKKYL